MSRYEEPLLDSLDEEEDLDGLSLFVPSPPNPAVEKALRRLARKKRILQLLFGATSRLSISSAVRGGFSKAGLWRVIDQIDAGMPYDAQDELLALLTDDSDDALGPDSPLDFQGRTALHYVLQPHLGPDDMARKCLASAETLETVLRAGPDPTVRDLAGVSPLDLADEEERAALLFFFTKGNKMSKLEKPTKSALFEKALGVRFVTIPENDPPTLLAIDTQDQLLVASTMSWEQTREWLQSFTAEKQAAILAASDLTLQVRRSLVHYLRMC